MQEKLKLKDYQKDAIRKMLFFLRKNESNSVLNGCEQGLGKSAQAVVTLGILDAKRILILCPAVMRYTWQDELNLWSTIDRKIIVLESGSQINKLKDLPVNAAVICSYDLARTSRVKEALSAFEYDGVIYDEAHYLKNRKAERTKVSLGSLFEACKYKIFLTGTPFLTRIVDGYTLFEKILPSKIDNFFKFADEFSYKRITNFGTDYYGVKNPDKLSELLYGNFFVRYLKKDVEKELPDKMFQTIKLDSRLSIKLEAEVAEQLQQAGRAIEIGKDVVVPRSLAEHRRLQGEKKFRSMAEFTQSLLEQDEPVVLFAYHRNLIEMFKNQFSKLKPSVITGDTLPKDRHDAVKRFQSGDTNLFIGQIVAAGVGITLTRSSNVVLAELDWSPSTIAQAVDRCHRIGQKNVVNVYDFVVPNSIDETISGLLMNRVRTFRKVLDEKAA